MRPPWLIRAELEIGEAEVAGKVTNPRILAYHAVTKLKATSDEIPWCASFVCAMLEWNNIPSTKSARALDFYGWGREIETPVEGCITVLNRGQDKGHVGFWMREVAGTVALLGGNQGNKVGIEFFPRSRILCYRMPLLKYWDPNGSDSQITE